MSHVTAAKYSVRSEKKKKPQYALACTPHYLRQALITRYSVSIRLDWRKYSIVMKQTDISHSFIVLL